MASTPPSRNDLAVGALLGETWRVVRAHPISLLWPWLIAGILTSGNSSSFAYDPMRTNANPITRLPLYSQFGLIEIIVLFVLLMFVYPLIVLVTTRAALDTLASGRKPEVGTAYRSVVHDYWGAFGTFVLWTLAVAVGFVLLIVPGFIVLAGLFPLAAVVVAEGTRGTAGLRRAWELTMGHKWHIFLVGLVLGLVSLVGSALLSWLPLIGGVLGGIVSGAVTGATLVAAVIYYKRRTASSAIVMPPLDAPPVSGPPAW